MEMSRLTTSRQQMVVLSEIQYKQLCITHPMSMAKEE